MIEMIVATHYFIHSLFLSFHSSLSWLLVCALIYTPWIWMFFSFIHVYGTLYWFAYTMHQSKLRSKNGMQIDHRVRKNKTMSTKIEIVQNDAMRTTNETNNVYFYANKQTPIIVIDTYIIHCLGNSFCHKSVSLYSYLCCCGCGFNLQMHSQLFLLSSLNPILFSVKIQWRTINFPHKLNSYLHLFHSVQRLNARDDGIYPTNGDFSFLEW